MGNMVTPGDGLLFVIAAKGKSKRPRVWNGMFTKLI